MRVLNLQGWACLLVLAAVLGQTRPTLAQPRILTVELDSVDEIGKTISVKIKNELFKRTLKVDGETGIQINGERAALADLAKGMRLEVIADIKKEIVSKINVRTADGGGRNTARMTKPSHAPSSSDSKEKESAEMPASGECPPELEPLDSLIRSYLAEEGVRGGAVAIVKDGRCVFARGYGHADLVTKVPVEPTTPFPIDGVSKTLTAAALVKLAEEGKVDLSGEFFEQMQTEPIANKDDLPAESRWVDARVIQLLKEPGRFRRDPFFEKYDISREFRKDFGDRIRSMADAQAVDTDEELSYDIDDVQYLLLGRMIAKMGGGKYEDYVKTAITGPLGMEQAKVSIYVRPEEEKEKKDKPVSPPNPRDRAKRKAEEEKKPKKKTPPKFAGIAQVQFEAGRDYEPNSLMLDAAGGWVASVIDLAKFARSLEDPENCPILNADSVDRLFAPISADEIPPADSEEVEAEEAEVRRRVGSQYFTSGWTIDRPEAGKPAYTSPRFVHSGPAAIASDGRLHIVFLLTTGFSASRSGGEPPLLVELAEAIKQVEKWPEIDLFSSPPTSESGEEDVAVMSADGASGATGDDGLVMLPTVDNSLGAQVEELIGLFLESYQGFLAKGGRRLMMEFRSSATPDFAAIGKRIPDGAEAVHELSQKASNDLQFRPFAFRQMVPADAPAQTALVESLVGYGEAFNSFAAKMDQLLRTEVAPADRPQELSDLLEREERMFAQLADCLAKTDDAFPLEVKAASSDLDFQRSVRRRALRMEALEQHMQSILAGRSARIRTISARGGGAPLAEQLQLPTLISDVQKTGAEMADAFAKQRELIGQYVQVETDAASKYLPGWQALAGLADAQAAYAQFVSKFNTPEAKPEKQAPLLEAIKTAKETLKTAREAAVAPGGAEPAAPADPAAPETETAPAPM